MEKLKQIAVFVANKPGTLSKVCKIMADHGVNILGLQVADAMDHAVLRFVVDKPQVAIHALGEVGLLVVESEIISIRLPNDVGKMQEVGSVLADAGINIEYAYGGVSSQDRTGTLFMKVSDVEKTCEIAEKMNW